MTAYTIRRLLALIPTLWLAVTLLFVLLRVIPGDAVTLMFQDFPAGREEYYEQARQEMGLGDPMYVQYGKFVGQVLRGDFGTSLWTGQNVTEEFLRKRLPVTLELGIAAAVMGIVMGVALGIIAALKQNSITDLSARTIAILGLAVPGFWLATLVIVLPSYWWQWSMPVGYRTFTEDPGGHLQQILIPAFIMSLVTAAVLMRYTRSMMLEVLRQDYVRSAYAKGLAPRIVILRHCLRNAMIPLVSVAGLQVAVLVSGTIIYEQIFSLPGVGTYLFQGVTRRDYPVVQGVAVFLTIWVLLINLVIDLTYPYLDPRVKL